MTIVTIANYSVALTGERTKEELEQIAKKIRHACLSNKDIVYGPSVWIDDFEQRDMEIITD